MILHLGVKTIESQLVAYKNLDPEEKPSKALAYMNKELYRKRLKIKNPVMIVFYDKKNLFKSKKEIVVPIDRKYKNIKTKIFPKIKAAFIVYSGTKNPIEYYYEKLENFIESNNFIREKIFWSIEAFYPPEQYELSYGSLIDEDASEYWETEILIPIKG